MIYIAEGENKKLPGMSSFFVSFTYNEDIINSLKTLEIYSYDKKNHTWEIPVTELSSLLDELTYLDDIVLTLLPDKTETSTINKITQQFKTKPFSYQLEGIQYGLNHDKWLLLDAPGLGKTLQIIYIAEELKARGLIEHCLVICGVNTLKTNWKEEIHKHSKLDCMILGEHVSKKGNISYASVASRAEQLYNSIKEFFIITNIETLRSNDIVSALDNSENKIGMLVVDEVHRCKSPSAQQTKNLLKLTNDKYKYRIGMTGTLLLNDPLDTYAPLKWIGAEKCCYTTFKNFYCNFTGQFHNIITSYKNTAILKEQINKYSLRRTKDLLNLPPKNIINEYIDMDEKQAKFYEDIKNGVKEEANKVDLKTTSLLALVTRLRQATACPSILTTNDIESSKIERACDLVDQILSNGDKVVIYSTFKETVRVLAEKLKQYNPLILTGDVKNEDIYIRKNAFQVEPDKKVIICTWQKMGTGITLTAASYAIFIDCAWTAGLNEQSEDRIYRIGTIKPVFIYYLWNKNTIDERVKDILDTKSMLTDYMIDDKVDTNTMQKLRDIITDL